MKTILILASLIVSLTMVSAKAMIIAPIVQYSGQALSVACDPLKETFCIDLCGKKDACIVKETLCRSCAGTEDLKLKRIFDGVGTSIVATGDAKANSDLLEVLKTGSFVSLSATTLYNYSGSFDGDQSRTEFRALCPNLPETSEKMGVLLLGLDSVDGSINHVLGAICPDQSYGQTSFFSTTSQWQATP